MEGAQPSMPLVVSLLFPYAHSERRVVRVAVDQREADEVVKEVAGIIGDVPGGTVGTIKGYQDGPTLGDESVKPSYLTGCRFRFPLASSEEASLELNA